MDIEAEYDDRDINSWSDVELIRAVAAVVSVPRVDPADSFVLHAPLELAARAAILPWVRHADRRLARLHIFAIASQYEAFGPAIEPGLDANTTGSEKPMAHPVASLVSAIQAGDLEAVDRAASEVARQATPQSLTNDLADFLLPLTGAAAHSPTFLYHLARVSHRGELSTELLRPLARDLARQPEWRIRWLDEWQPSGETNPSAVGEVLVNAPTLGIPGSSFIHPMLMQVDESGLAANTLGPILGHHSDAAAWSILRTAATTLLADNQEHVPYGWTHCLTLPQAVLGLAGRGADPDRAMAIAATEVLAMRSALGSGPLAPIDVADLPPVDPVALASAAAIRHDAHVVKYTLTSLDLAAADPAHARLYLGAATKLMQWWDDAGGDPDDPLTPAS